MEQNAASDCLLTPEQLAAEFGEFFTEPRLRQWRYRGFGPRHLKLGRRCLYRRSDVSEWIEANLRSGTSESEPGGDESSVG